MRERKINKRAGLALLGAGLIAASSAVTTQAAQTNFPSKKAIELKKEKINKPTLRAMKAKVFVDGKEVYLTDQVMQYNGRSYLPIKALSKVLENQQIMFDNNYKVAVISNYDKTVEMMLFRNKAILNRQDKINLDGMDPNISVALHHNRIYLPVRTCAEIMGFEITYFGTNTANTEEIHIATKGNTLPTQPTYPRPSGSTGGSSGVGPSSSETPTAGDGGHWNDGNGYGTGPGITGDYSDVDPGGFN